MADGAIVWFAPSTFQLRPAILVSKSLYIIGDNHNWKVHDGSHKLFIYIRRFNICNSPEFLLNHSLLSLIWKFQILERFNLHLTHLTAIVWHSHKSSAQKVRSQKIPNKSAHYIASGDITYRINRKLLPSVRRSRSQFISHHSREGTRLIVANAAEITLYLLLLFSQSSKSSSSQWCERRKLRRCDVRQLIYDLCTGPLVRLLGSGCTHEINPKF